MFVLKNHFNTSHFIEMASTTITKIGEWRTFHDNGPFPTKYFLDTKLASKGSFPNYLDYYNDAAIEMQRLLQDSINSKERFRAIGSAWSLSDIAHQRDRMQYNGRMNMKWTISTTDLHSKSPYKSENLFFFQCGNIIKEVSEFLALKAKSLKTAGASNGQTIGGALSTGIHGSSIDVGSFQDCIVGLNLIIGPGPNDRVYLERHTRPALNSKCVATFKSRVIRNDGLFNAALVGLGSFGFIHGVLLQAEDRFLLKRYTCKIKRDDALRLAKTMNFKFPSGIDPVKIPEAAAGTKPFHYKLYVNPYNKKEDFVAEIIYKHPYKAGYPDPIPRVKTSVYKDLPDFMAVIAAKYNRLIPLLMGALKGNIFPAPDTENTGTLGEIFWDSQHAGPAFAIALGIEYTKVEQALDLFINVANTAGPVPGAIGIRFIKGSEATLAFSKFPLTCMLEMDGITWKGNAGMISLLDFETRLFEAFRSAGIAFTLHWGKNTAWHLPGLINYMYGTADDTWMDYRSALLGKQSCDLFNNDSYRPAASSKLIANLLNG
jgi:hypothetical protein